MQIYVNEQKLEAQLSGENNLSEIYEQINRWSAEHKKYILDLKVDNRNVSLGSLSDIPVDGVERLDFYIGNEMEMVLSTIDELDRYIDQVGSVLYESIEIKPSDVKDLKDGMHWIRQIMNSLSAILNMDLNALNPAFAVKGGDDSASVEEILVGLEVMVDDFTGGAGRSGVEKFLDELRRLKYFVMKLQMQLRAMNANKEDLINLLQEFENTIPGLVEEAVSINADFNAGQDRRALETLDKFTEKLNLYISVLYALDYKNTTENGPSLMRFELDGVPFHTIAMEFTELLQDLSSALEESDIIAAGDIMEYELTERLGQMLPYLSGIGQLIVAGK